MERARRDGRANVDSVVLGRAASAPGFIGFAVVRTTFWDAVAAYRAHTVTRQEVSARVARRFREWAAIFEGTVRPVNRGRLPTTQADEEGRQSWTTPCARLPIKGVALLAVTAVIVKWPKVLAIPLGVLLGWVAICLLVRVATLNIYGRRLSCDPIDVPGRRDANAARA